jgi:hypothetical protein
MVEHKLPGNENRNKQIPKSSVPTICDKNLWIITEYEVLICILSINQSILASWPHMGLCQFPAGCTSHSHFAPSFCTTAETVGSNSRRRPWKNEVANRITWSGMQPRIELSITKKLIWLDLG